MLNAPNTSALSTLLNNYSILRENNVLMCLSRFLDCEIDEVEISALATFSMLIQNTTDSQELCTCSVIVVYIFSYLALHNAFTANYNFDNGDLTTQYIAFLKSIAIRLDQNSINIFYNDVSLLSTPRN